MNQVLTAEGMRNLRMSWAVLVLSIVAAAGIAFGSHWYVAQEKREGASSQRRLQEASARVEGAKRERESLQDSAATFRTLVDRGLLQGERRLDLVEMVNTLRSSHQLFGLDYEIGAQRPLQLVGGRVFPAVDVLASRVKLRMRALHEGDVLGFIQDLAQSHQGFYPLDRCVIRRIEGAVSEVVQAHVEAECAFEWITLKEKSANRPS